MKKQVFGSLAATLMFLFVTASVKAQVDSVQILSPVSVQSSVKLTEKVRSSFYTRFKDATDPRWEKLNRNFLVQFTSASLNNQAVFQPNGYMVYHLAYRTESTMASDVRAIVKANYADYSIIDAVEVEYGRRSIWLITVVNKDRVITVRYEDNTLEEIRNMVNASA